MDEETQDENKTYFGMTEAEIKKLKKELSLAKKKLKQVKARDRLKKEQKNE